MFESFKDFFGVLSPRQLGLSARFMFFLTADWAVRPSAAPATVVFLYNGVLQANVRAEKSNEQAQLPTLPPLTGANKQSIRHNIPRHVPEFFHKVVRKNSL
jgi:hypothetical protein